MRLRWWCVSRYSSEVDTGDDEWGSSGSLGARAARNDAAAARAHADLVERTAAVMQILAVNVARVDTTRVIEVRPRAMRLWHVPELTVLWVSARAVVTTLRAARGGTAVA